MAKKYNFTGPSLLFAAGVLAMALLVASDGGVLSQYLSKGESSAVEASPEGPMMVDGRPVREAGPPQARPQSTASTMSSDDSELMVDPTGFDPTPEDFQDAEPKFAAEGEEIREIDEDELGPPPGFEADTGFEGAGPQIDESQIID